MTLKEEYEHGCRNRYWHDNPQLALLHAEADATHGTGSVTIASEQFFCFTGKIQRDIGDCAVLSIAALGKADGVFGVAVGDIPFKRGRGLIFAALYFNGDDFYAILQHEVDLAGFVRVIAGFHFKLTAELL